MDRPYFGHLRGPCIYSPPLLTIDCFSLCSSYRLDDWQALGISYVGDIGTLSFRRIMTCARRFCGSEKHPGLGLLFLESFQPLPDLLSSTLAVGGNPPSQSVSRRQRAAETPEEPLALRSPAPAALPSLRRHSGSPYPPGGFAISLQEPRWGRWDGIRHSLWLIIYSV